MDLSRAARSLGRENEGGEWLAAAVESGCFEAQRGMP